MNNVQTRQNSLQGEIFTHCVMCGVKMLKEDCTKKGEEKISVEGYDENDLGKVLTQGVTIDVLIKHFSEEKLSDDLVRQLSKIEEDMLFLKEIDIQYDMSTMEVTTLIDKLIK